MSTHTFFAYLAVVILAGLAVFQVLLAAGRPLGRFAWGGQHDVLPPNLRTGSLVSILLYAVFAVIILERLGCYRLASAFRTSPSGRWQSTSRSAS